MVHINTTSWVSPPLTHVQNAYLDQHGSESVTSYVNLSPSYKNPADSGSTQGAKITLDSTSYWNGQTMRRTELIPQTTAAINSGHVYYHFSIMHSATNPPSLYREHQICFFESHFTELKSGWISGETGTSDPLLRWDVSGSTQWSTTWTAGVWHNVAYDIVHDPIPHVVVHSLTSDTELQRRDSSLLALHRLESTDPHRPRRKCVRLIQRRRLALGCPRAPSHGAS